VFIFRNKQCRGNVLLKPEDAGTAIPEVQSVAAVKI
jgi:hypothetical protein